MTYRPLFHFTAERGWINDPNGLCFYKGKYHLFYQYNPHSTEWGKMHWGHAISSDLVNWEHLDIALSPDEWYEDDERGGCFSGSAMVIGDRLYLMYTATAGGKQRQCIAYSDDGLNFTKYDKNPIIEPPEGIHEERDPYIFRLHDRYLTLVGMPGKIELYSSCDLLSWNDEGCFYSLPPEMGSFVECPGIFFLGDEAFLTFSPMHFGCVGAPVTVIRGKMDGLSFIPSSVSSADSGPDFYALQTFLTNKGERCGFAWANGWEWMDDFRGFGPTEKEGWRGCMAFPRIYSLKEGHLSAFPVSEAEECYNIIEIDDRLKLTAERTFLPRNDVFHLSLSLDPGIGDVPELEIGIYKDSTKELSLIVDFHSLTAYLVELSDGSVDRIFKTSFAEGEFSVDVFADKSITEIYLGKGYSSFTINTYRNEDYRGPWIRALSGTIDAALRFSLSEE